MMNVPPPQQTIEQRRQVVMVADDGFANVGAVDHVGMFQQDKAGSAAHDYCQGFRSVVIVSQRAVSINSDRENAWASNSLLARRAGLRNMSCEN